ncbi:MAG: hypothetical protein JWO48_1489 [Bryobacterales bacterium]|nr:hypothetical protein [Bryobacterales bacterium]
MRFLSIALLVCTTLAADPFSDLARDFWKWRAVQQPISQDDIPRIDRPADWAPDWSKESVAKQREALAQFEQRWKELDATSWPVPRQVDYRLIGSAIARVHWELDVTRNWQRNPAFYVDQTLAALVDRLLQPPPFDLVRSREILHRLGAIPKILEDAKANLDRPARPFAQLAIGELKDVRPRLLKALRELKPLLDPNVATDIDGAALKAITALESYRAWLDVRVSSMPAETAIGRDAYVGFLKNVALMPYTPEQLLDMARQEWERSVAFESYERQRNAGLPQLSLPANQAEQVAREKRDEAAVRKYLDTKGFLTFPPWLQHYWNQPLPAYLEALPELGVTDDLTGPARLKENAVSYVRPPSPELGFFEGATARDPRVMIVHEGMHFYQLALSWAHEDPIRRHYYDSGANEGIGFYAEEMALQAGLFDDSPRSRQIIYSFMRLRALRVEADVKLALGLFTIDQAANYLQKTVPMDERTAQWEAAFFASLPGQAITYQIGKLQIMQMLADARRIQGDKFNLKAFHDYVWKNGNVPIALQRWEYLGIKPAGL